MKTKILLISLIFTLKALASIPTTEGLFRNGSNADVAAPLVLVKAMVSTEISNMLMDKTTAEVPEGMERAAIEEKEPQKYFVKFILSAEQEERVQLIQVIYKSGKMNDSGILNIRYFSNLKEKILKSPTRLALFYSLLSSFALNRSEEISAFLKLTSKNYRPNEALVDTEKDALYKRYKRYLTVVKEDESLKDTMDNPLRPEDPEVKKVANEIRDRPFMVKDKNVSLIKTQSGFQWAVKLDVLEAYFDNKNRRLERLLYGQLDKNTVFSFDDYILFDGTHELPKTIKIVAPEETINIRMTSLNHLNLGNKSMTFRYGEYRDLFKKVSKDNQDGDLSLFLLR
jgi:hypothetical protein